MSGHNHTLLLVGNEGDEVMATLLFIHVGTLGRDELTSGRGGDEVVVTFIFPPLGREGVRSWSHLSSLIWEGEG